MIFTNSVLSARSLNQLYIIKSAKLIVIAMKLRATESFFSQGTQQFFVILTPFTLLTSNIQANLFFTSFRVKAKKMGTSFSKKTAINHEVQELLMLTLGRPLCFFLLPSNTYFFLQLAIMSFFPTLLSYISSISFRSFHKDHKSTVKLRMNFLSGVLLPFAFPSSFLPIVFA